MQITATTVPKPCTVTDKRKNIVDWKGMQRFYTRP